MTIIAHKSFVSGLVFASALSMLSMGCDDDDDGSALKEDVALTVAMEVPAPMGTTTASGTYKYEMMPATGVMTYTLTVANLTGPAQAAHIHLGPVGVAGPVVLPLLVPSTGTSVSGTVTLDAKAMADLTAGTLYVNVHTAANPAGEIRGQLKGK